MRLAWRVAGVPKLTVAGHRASASLRATVAMTAWPKRGSPPWMWYPSVWLASWTAAGVVHQSGRGDLLRRWAPAAERSTWPTQSSRRQERIYL